MTDIFISYKREDRAIAESVAQAFVRRGYTVWWDASLLAGDVFVEEINRQLGAAQIAITLWSEAALQSRWVQAETLAAWNDDKYLGAVIEPGIQVLAPFNGSHNEDLTSFAAGTGDLVRLMQVVEARIGPPPQEEIDEEAADEELRASEAEAAIWFKIHDSRDPDAFRFYLDQYGENAKFAKEARGKIKSLGSISGRIARTGGWGLGLAVALSAIVVAGASAYQAVKPSDNARIAMFERDVSALRERLDTTEAERQRAIEERDAAASAEENRTARIDALLPEKELFEQRIVGLSQTVTELRAAQSASATTQSEAEAQIAALEREKAAAEKQVVAMTARIAELESSLPMPETAEQAARREYPCPDGEEGVFWTEKCWPLDTTRIGPFDLTSEERSNMISIVPLAGLSDLQSLYLFGTSVMDISALSGLSGLQILDLSGTSVVDISALSGLSGLKSLNLAGTLVTDISALSGLSGLQILYLSRTSVVDISALSGLSGLQTLTLGGIPVTDLSPLKGLNMLSTFCPPTSACMYGDKPAVQAWLDANVRDR